MDVVLIFCGVVLTTSALLVVTRIAWGPTMLDRIIAVDVLVAVMICGLAVEAAVNRHTSTLVIIVVLSLLGFVGSATVARFTRGSDDVDAEQS